LVLITEDQKYWVERGKKKKVAKKKKLPDLTISTMKLTEQSDTAIMIIYHKVCVVCNWQIDLYTPGCTVQVIKKAKRVARAVKVVSTHSVNRAWMGRVGWEAVTVSRITYGSEVAWISEGAYEVERIKYDMVRYLTGGVGQLR
jgi:hypothetical protein